MAVASKPVAAADAIVDLLAQGLGNDYFSMTFTAERAYRPVQKLQDLELTAPKITVIPASCEIVRASRGEFRYDATCAIVIQARPTSQSNEHVDPYMDLADEVIAYLGQFDVEFTSSRIALGNDPILVPEHLTELGVFTSVVNVTYRLFQSQDEV